MKVSYLNASHKESSPIWEQHALRSKPLISGIQYSLQHGLVEETVTHPFTDDDVYLLHRQSDLLYFALNDLNNCR
ncbi:hypothetical protein E2C01_004454 [Portunus trituberculatus]|uniref:Uncharacterized protein n=1 Tax=Portunus trituberculatus TaxID=210409 RepID=A0A5B7CQK1_PORTR|nr:hypothetical protein [Portunus trituberculatus]